MDAKLNKINKIIAVCKKLVHHIDETGDAKTGDEFYEKYKKMIYSFCNEYDIKNNQSESVQKSYCILNAYYWQKNYTVNITEANTILNAVYDLKLSLFPNYCEKLFISHSEKDKEQVDAFIELLYAIGIPRPLQNGESIIFCSSHPTAYIENGQMIDEQILQQFNCKQNVLFILWYTDNYFESQACLNEMGAVWAMNKKYQEILMPNFDRKKIGGLLPKEKISFYANDKFRLNTLKKQIEELFMLQPVDQNAWEIARDKYIETINKLSTFQDNSKMIGW